MRRLGPAIKARVVGLAMALPVRQLSSAPVTLKDSTLMRSQSFIDGAWADARSGACVDVANPATGAIIGTVPDMGQAETRQAIDAAAAAFPAWRGKLGKERGAILRRWFDLIIANQDDLAAIMTAECGKPLAESAGEIGYAASFVEWYAEEAKRLYGDTIPQNAHGRRLLTTKQPIGVVGAITPWNFPSAMITRKVAPALAVGCPVVIKPSELTPYSALALAALAERAGFPAGVLNIVTGANAKEIGDELCANPTVRKLGFTGSTRVGKLLMAQCAATVKRVSLELGGNAPLIIFDDADLDKAVAGTLASKYRNCGQTCVCANRIFVHDAIYDEFAQRLGAAVGAMRQGAGHEDGVSVGPLINAAAVDKVAEHVEDALGKGARLVVGGERRNDLGAGFYAPTVLADATPQMRVFAEETFGPVAPLFRFTSEAEVVAMANDTPYGLAAYLFSENLGRCVRVAEALEYGMVGVNEGVISTEVAPFGGVKESGLGREGAYQGAEEFLETKYVCLGGIGEALHT